MEPMKDRKPLERATHRALGESEIGVEPLPISQIKADEMRAVLLEIADMAEKYVSRGWQIDTRWLALVTRKASS